MGQLLTKTGVMGAPVYLARDTANSNTIVVVKKYNVDKHEHPGTGKSLARAYKFSRWALPLLGALVVLQV